MKVGDDRDLSQLDRDWWAGSHGWAGWRGRMSEWASRPSWVGAMEKK
jgi:hypothetical protein